MEGRITKRQQALLAGNEPIIEDSVEKELREMDLNPQNQVLTSDESLSAFWQVNGIIASEIAFLLKIRRFSWNISGEIAITLRKELCHQHHELNEAIDELVKSLVQMKLKIQPMDVLKDASFIQDSEYVESCDVPSILDIDNKAFCYEIQNAIYASYDSTIKDALTKLLKFHKNLSWILNDYIEEEAEDSAE